jgi:hypothetical protein
MLGKSAAIISAVLLSTLGTNAATLIESHPAPYFINQLDLGDAGNQVETTTINPNNNFNFYWFSSTTAAVFNYSVTYAATEPSFAHAGVFRLTFPQYGSGNWLAYNDGFNGSSDPLGTSPSGRITASGSIQLEAHTAYLLRLALYRFTEHEPYDTGYYIDTGSYRLNWSLDGAAQYASILSWEGGDPAYVLNLAPVPIPAPLLLFATGGGVLALLGWRRKRKAAAAV